MPRKKHHLNPDGTRKTLVQQAGEVKGDAAYHSGRVIGEVDAMNFKMEKEKKMRRDRVNADQKEIKHLEDERERLMVRYRPLVERLEARKAEREKLRQLLQETHDKVHGFIGSSRSTKAHALTNQGHLRAKAAKEELKLCRGFSCDIGTTADRTGRLTAGSRLQTAGSSIGHSAGRISRSMSKASVNIGLRVPSKR